MTKEELTKRLQVMSWIKLQISYRQYKIISLIKENNAISASLIALKLSTTPRTIQRDLAILRLSNIIERAGSSKGGYWKILKTFR